MKEKVFILPTLNSRLENYCYDMSYDMYDIGYDMSSGYARMLD